MPETVLHAGDIRVKKADGAAALMRLLSWFKKTDPKHGHKNTNKQDDFRCPMLVRLWRG